MERETAESLVVPTKSGNASHADPVEGRGDRNATEPEEGTTLETKGSEEVYTKLDRIAELAREHPDWALSTLAHAIDIEFLREAYARTRKSGAVGVDGQTADEYAVDLDANLTVLLERFKSGSYRAPPVKRVHIPKGDGKTRPIGIPTFEDKVLQRAVTMVLEAIYEQDFMDCSYGYRRGRSAHQALEATWRATMSFGAGWVIELDIQSFFDSLDRAQLRGFLDRRVKDGVIRRVIGKWLSAGVLEDGVVERPKGGTPQGGVISPILANIYLHEVLDTWFEREVKPRLKGRATLIRFADDAVLVLSAEEDARRLMDVLPKRFEKYGLRLHPEKTRLLRFERPRDGDDDDDRPGSFDFLSFTHYWAKSRKGAWIVKRKTSKSRFTRSIKRVREWCAKNRHLPIEEQHRTLTQKLRGHYAYFGITGNGDAIGRFAFEVRCAWHYWLERRSQRGKMSWDRFNVILKRLPLPPPRIVHSIYA